VARRRPEVARRWSAVLTRTAAMAWPMAAGEILYRSLRFRVRHIWNLGIFIRVYNFVQILSLLQIRLSAPPSSTRKGTMLALAWLPPAGEERQDTVPVRQVSPPPYAELPMSSLGPLPVTGTHHTRYARSFSSLPAVPN